MYNYWNIIKWLIKQCLFVNDKAKTILEYVLNSLYLHTCMKIWKEILVDLRSSDEKDIHDPIEFFTGTLNNNEMLQNWYDDLSSGQEQKLCIALFIIGNTKISMMDEKNCWCRCSRQSINMECNVLRIRFHKECLLFHMTCLTLLVHRLSWEINPNVVTLLNLMMNLYI
jgi:hypothetical protein